MRISKLSVFLVIFSCALCLAGAARTLSRVGVLSPAVPAAALDASLLDVDESLVNNLNGLDDPEEYLKLEDSTEPLIALQVDSTQTLAAAPATTTAAPAPVVATAAPVATTAAPAPAAPAPAAAPAAPAPAVAPAVVTTPTIPITGPALPPVVIQPPPPNPEPMSLDATQIAKILTAQAQAQAQATLAKSLAAPMKEPVNTVRAPEANMLAPDVLKALGYPVAPVGTPRDPLPADATPVPAGKVVANVDSRPGPDIFDSEADKRAADEAAFKAILAAHNTAASSVSAAVQAVGVPADQAQAIASAAAVAAVQQILSASSTGASDPKVVAAASAIHASVASSTGTASGLVGNLVKPVVIDPTENPNYPEAKVLFLHHFSSMKKADGTYDVKPLSPTDMLTQYPGLVRPADPRTTNKNHVAPEIIDRPEFSSSSSGVSSSSSSTGPVFVNPEYKFNPNDQSTGLQSVPTLSLKDALGATGFATPELYKANVASGSTYQKIYESMAAAVNQPRTWEQLKSHEQFHHIKEQYPVQPVLRDPPVMPSTVPTTVQEQLSQIAARLNGVPAAPAK